jgi:heme iron utilization protein
MSAPTTDGAASDDAANDARSSDHGPAARAILRSTTVGSLATIALDPAGHPFASLVAYALDGQGRPVLCLSSLAEHSRNLAADDRASLMAAEAIGGEDPLALGRVTLVGSLVKLDGADADDARSAFMAAHPDAFYASFADFSMYRLDVTSVRYVGGFGRMSWVDPAEL